MMIMMMINIFIFIIVMKLIILSVFVSSATMQTVRGHINNT